MDVHQKKLIQINAVLVKLMSVVTDIITDWHDYDFLILSLIFFIQNINRWCIPLSDLFPLMKVAQIGFTNISINMISLG